jgi:CheY-like chemotaxis protein
MAVPVIPKKRILVVDDEPFVCDAVKMMLAFDGHDVQTANSGREALELFNQSRFDLVITDFAMPQMKGDELAAALKVRVPGQPVIMITAYAEMLQSAGAPLTGVDFVISKPFLLENLREALFKVLPAPSPSTTSGSR